MAEVGDWKRSSLGARLAHAAHLRGLSLLDLGERAGVPAAALLDLDEREHARGGDHDALLRLANAAGVAFAWLAFGWGEPELPWRDETLEDRFRNRAAAARIALDGGVSPAAVEAVRRDDPALASDMPVYWWILRIQERERGLAAPAARRPAWDPEDVEAPRRRERR